MLPYIIICAALLLVCALLIIKIVLMRKSIKEICDGIGEQLSSDVNISVSVSSRDKYVLRLAEKIQAELRELRRLRNKYVNGDRELKDAITNASHDLRTPLTAICGYLELLEKEDKSENVSRYISYIAERAEAMRALSEELFRYSVTSSVSELCYGTLDIKRVLEDTLLSYFGELERRGICPEISLPEGGVMRRLDKSALTRIFENIISNALKYAQSTLSVTLTEDGRAVFSNPAPQVSALDAGRLFDRFYTVSSAKKSTGLGLSIAKLLIERMGGKIGAEYKGGALYINLEFPE